MSWNRGSESKCLILGFVDIEKKKQMGFRESIKHLNWEVNMDVGVHMHTFQCAHLFTEYATWMNE